MFETSIFGKSLFNKFLEFGPANAAPAHFANELFQKTVNQFRNLNLITRTGIFQETMSVELVNEGPVTIWIDSKDKDMPRKSS